MASGERRRTDDDGQQDYERPGPLLQAELLGAGQPLPLDKVEAFAARAREMTEGEVRDERTPGG